MIEPIVHLISERRLPRTVYPRQLTSQFGRKNIKRLWQVELRGWTYEHGMVKRLRNTADYRCKRRVGGALLVPSLHDGGSGWGWAAGSWWNCARYSR